MFENRKAYQSKSFESLDEQLPAEDLTTVASSETFDRSVAHSESAETTVHISQLEQQGPVNPNASFARNETLIKATDGRLENAGIKMGALFAKLGAGATAMWEAGAKGIRAVDTGIANISEEVDQMLNGVGSDLNELGSSMQQDTVAIAEKVSAAKEKLVGFGIAIKTRAEVKTRNVVESFMGKWRAAQLRRLEEQEVAHVGKMQDAEQKHRDEEVAWKKTRAEIAALKAKFAATAKGGSLSREAVGFRSPDLAGAAA